ncbi:MAG TPA: hypothetical protein VL171_03595 [Verrucomicrobiae bacterium]|nr:hypothetical protein [Verrucomicrobiae bacterium]
MTEWDIQSRADVCAVCQRPFVDKEVYHTLLSLEPTGYQRRDLCGNCHANASRVGVLSYWQGEYRVPAPPPEPIQKETAETLLRKLVESTDPGQAAARYILAVMLERKKILKHRGTVHEKNGGELLVYEHTRSGESFTIPDPHLRLDQLEQVQREVSELLRPPEDPNKTEADPLTGSASASSVGR